MGLQARLEGFCFSFMNTSANNKNIVLAKKLLQKKYRDLEKKYLVEGAKLVREVFSCNQSVDFLVVSENDFDKYTDILDGKKFFTVDERTFSTLTDTVTDQGILAVVNKPSLPLRSPESNALVLDRLQDPSNVGAILRTAAAAGYNDVYMVECADPYSPKCIRAGLSSQFRLNIFSASAEEILAEIKGNCPLICADMDGENVFDCGRFGRHALVLGNEGGGVGEIFRSVCDKTVSLPMSNGVESLNVAVSAGILMYLLTNSQTK